jgi:hypothetical protein
MVVDLLENFSIADSLRHFLDQILGNDCLREMDASHAEVNGDRDAYLMNRRPWDRHRPLVGMHLIVRL